MEQLIKRIDYFCTNVTFFIWPTNVLSKGLKVLQTGLIVPNLKNKGPKLGPPKRRYVIEVIINNRNFSEEELVFILWSALLSIPYYVNHLDI